jgi:exodeoxyribonuclease VII large subunit
LRAATQTLVGPIALRHERVRTRHAHLLDRLHAVSPLAVLDRGYAVVQGPDGRAITDAAVLTAGDPLRIRLARGRVGARVTDVESSSQEVE